MFETLRVYRGVPFAWRRHYARLCASADALD
ncbi:MAG: aminotransferase class IV, partial [Acidimicrobiia bacterium]